ncbi:cell division protein FtsZ [Candidatus Kapabacteria bacterium]|nr:cell division protein FtsZ [Candidatus Kapabacteria bacterium]
MSDNQPRILLDDTALGGAKIKVIGVGGGGGNAINNMIERGLTGVEFIAANTDKQALEHNLADVKIQIGRETTRGLGAGANPERGKESILESENEVKEALKGADMIFVTCGMGGGTGTGSAPEIAKIGQSIGALVVGIVTKPFIFEGKRRVNIADTWIDQLRENVDALIVIPNQKLLEIIDKNTGFKEAFSKVDEVLYNATRGISDIISRHGYVNVDFADVVTIMKGMGDALMGIGIASGEHRAVQAAEKALNSPLLDGISIEGAKGLLVNITGGQEMTMHEISDAVTLIEEKAGGDANLIKGIVFDESMNDEFMVTVVATGFNCIKEEEETEVNEPEQMTIPKNVFGGRTVFGEGRFDNIQKPSGQRALKKYDTPTYLRNGKSGVPLGDNSNTTASKIQSSNVKDEAKSKTIQAEPAFLRRIRD